MKAIMHLKGGSGSGNFNHQGRPGEVGGSSTDYGLVMSKVGTKALEAKTDELIKTVNVTSKQKRALKNYKYGDIDSGYLQINKQLRGQAESTDSVQSTIRDIDSAMESNTLSESYIVYRGVDNTFPVKIGMKFKDAGYASISLAVNRPLNLSNTPGLGDRIQGSIFRIDVQSGSHGIWMDGIVKGMYEHELLLPRGGTFTIVRDVTESVQNYLPRYGDKIGGEDLPRIYEVIYEP